MIRLEPERPALLTHGKKTPKLAMKEQEINAIPFVADAQPFLAANEGEVAAEFQEEMFEVVDERVFEVGLGVFVFKAEKFENEGVFDLLFRGDDVRRDRLAAFLEHGNLVPGQGGALVELGGNLAIKLADRPAAAQGFGFVEDTGFRRFHGEQADVVRPGQWKGLGESGKIGRVYFFRRRLKNLEFVRQCLVFR